MENLLLSLCFVVKRTYEGQHGGLNEYDSKNLRRCLDVGGDAPPLQCVIAVPYALIMIADNAYRHKSVQT